MKQRVLFVGHSDTRITPLCAAIMKYLCVNKEVENIEFSSSGFWAMEGQRVHPTLLRSAGEIGIDLSEYQSHYVTMEDIQSASFIIPQDAMVARGVASVLGEGNKEKLFRPMQVYEPDNSAIQVFRRSREECIAFCEKLLKKLMTTEKEREKISSAVVYRPVTKEEAAQVLLLEEVCFSHPWTLANIEAEIEKENSIFLGAFYEEKMVGYASLYYVAGAGFMNNVGVHPDYRHLGIGETLMGQLETLSIENNLKVISLEVRSKNKAAIGMYQKLGYEKKGTRPFFYRDPMDDADIMTKIIQEIPENDGIYHF